MKQIIFGMVGVFCVYLLASFIEVTFNITQWPKELRICVALLMPVGFTTGLTASTLEDL